MIKHNEIYMRRLRARPGWKKRARRGPPSSRHGLGRKYFNAPAPAAALIGVMSHALAFQHVPLWLRLHAVSYPNAARMGRHSRDAFSPAGRKAFEAWQRASA